MLNFTLNKKKNFFFCLFCFSFPIQISKRLKSPKNKILESQVNKCNNITSTSNLNPTPNPATHFFAYFQNLHLQNYTTDGFLSVHTKWVNHPQQPLEFVTLAQLHECKSLIARGNFFDCQVPPSIKACQPTHSPQQSFLSRDHPFFQRN